jgi:hypothetical protein
MNKFTSLQTFKQQHRDVYTMSWIYAGITAYFSQQNQFHNLEFNSTANTLFCKDWSNVYTDSKSSEQQYFGFVNEGHIDYWFPITDWENVTLVTGHENNQQYPKNIKSIGFDRWDLVIQNIYSDPVLYGEINREDLSYCEHDILCLTGAHRPHRVQFLIRANHQLQHLKIVTDDKQQLLETNYRTTALGFESYFNKVDIDQFRNYKMLPSFYKQQDTFALDWVPHQKMYSSCRVNAILETTVYDTKHPFVSEKTWKALAQGRPFVILGDTNILNKLKSKGFMTFDKFCDESYDVEPSVSNRTDMVITALDQLVTACKTSPAEIDKICKHNQSVFFDVSRTNSDLAKFGKLCLDELYNI